MAKKKLTNEQITEIKELFSQGMIVADIARKYEVSSATVSYHLGLTKRGNGYKVCPQCHKKMDARDNYCSRYGCDIRSDEDMLVEAVATLRSMLIHLPENARMKADDITQALIKYFKKVKR